MSHPNTKIFAIGGGDIYIPSFISEILTFCNKPNPRILIIPTAKNDNEYSAIATANKYQEHTNVGVKILYTISNAKYNQDKAEEDIAWADIIWVPGGNTLLLMKTWRKRGVDLFVSRARDRGVVLAGSSAGMLVWFDSGHSDSMSYYLRDKVPGSKGVKYEDWDYVNVQCMGFIEGLTGCPHFHGEGRVESFMKMVEKDCSIELGIGVDDGAAFQVMGDQYRIFETEEDTNAYCVWRDVDEDGGLTIVNIDKLESTTEYQPLESLWETYYRVPSASQ